MEWILIILVIAVLLWAIARIVQVINNFVITLKGLPESYDLQKKYYDTRGKLSEKEYELHLLKNHHEELTKRWQQLRKRKEELRHENRLLRKQIPPLPLTN